MSLRVNAFLCRGLRPVTLFKKRLWRRCFPVNFPKFLETPFLQTPPDGCFCIINRSERNLISRILSSKNTTPTTCAKQKPCKTNRQLNE